MISVQRSQPPPESLERTTAYDGDDVRERLRQDFFDKCYLCERVLSGGWNVEHLRPKAPSGRFAAQRQDWDNLFPADGCNQCRKTWPLEERIDEDTPYPEGGLLDPARDPNVEERLIQRLANVPPVRSNDLRVVFEAADAEDEAAVNTAADLTHIHHSGRANAVTLRRDLFNRWLTIQHRIIGCYREEPHAMEDLRTLVRPDQPFSAVIRGTIGHLYPDLFEKLRLPR